MTPMAKKDNRAGRPPLRQDNSTAAPHRVSRLPAGKAASRRRMDAVGIARLVGVARSTVSKVLNGYPHVAPETRTRILQAVRAHKYYPNLSAQILAGKKTRTLGLFFINPRHFSEDVLADFMISSLIEHASFLGYHTLAYVIRDPRDATTKDSIRETFYQGRIAAGIFIGARNREPIIEELVAGGNAVGVFDQSPSSPAEPNRVVANFDDVRTARSAIDYLASLGHTDIAVIHGDRRRNAGAMKHRGFLAGLRAHGLPIRREWMLTGDFQSEAGYRVMQGLLAADVPLPTAVATVNDNTAFGAMRAIAESGLRIPEDISIVGIDGHPFCEYARPPLTTFEFSFPEMIRGLVSAVISLAADQSMGAAMRQVYSARLVERHSCRRIQNAVAPAAPGE